MNPKTTITISLKPEIVVNILNKKQTFLMYRYLYRYLFSLGKLPWLVKISVEESNNGLYKDTRGRGYYLEDDSRVFNKNNTSPACMKIKAEVTKLRLNNKVVASFILNTYHHAYIMKDKETAELTTEIKFFEPICDNNNKFIRHHTLSKKEAKSCFTNLCMTEFDVWRFIVRYYRCDPFPFQACILHIDDLTIFKKPVVEKIQLL